MKRRRTLRGRVSLLALGVIAGWLVVLNVVFNVVLIRRVDGQADDTLRVRAQAASSTLAISASGHITVRESATDSELDSSVWVYAGHTVVDRGAGRPELQAAAKALAGTGPAYSDETAETRFFALPVRHDGRQIGTVVVALSTRPYDRAQQAALFGSVIVSLLLLAGAYPVLRFATSRALRPVAAMTRQAADWSAHLPSARFGTGQHLEELQALAGNLDALLDRLSAVLRHERQLSAELSHELRTPLTHIAAEVDLMLSHQQSRAEEKAAHVRIHERAAAMDMIIETLLNTARAEQQDSATGSASVDRVLSSIIADLDATVTVEYEPSGLSVGVDAPVFERIVVPIIDNAQRYAQSRIWMRTVRDGGQLAIDVSNDGPVLAAGLAERIFEAGFRAGDQDAHPGVGLGLALARRLARSADGDVSVVPSADVMTFRVTLPPG